MIKEILFREEDLMTEEELNALVDMYKGSEGKELAELSDDLRPESDPLELLGKNRSKSRRFVSWGGKKRRSDDGDTLG